LCLRRFEPCHPHSLSRRRARKPVSEDPHSYLQSKGINMKNQHTQALIQTLKKTSIEQKSPFWKRVAEDLEKPSRQRRIVNVFKIDTYAQEGDIVIVPGKVLGEGDLTKKVTVAAFSFSDEARSKISKSGKVMTIAELIKSNPKGQKVKILG
jgi:large subunit ribosomal protein L18e